PLDLTQTHRLLHLSQNTKARSGCTKSPGRLGGGNRSDVSQTQPKDRAKSPQTASTAGLAGWLGREQQSPRHAGEDVGKMPDLSKKPGLAVISALIGGEMTIQPAPRIWTSCLAGNWSADQLLATLL